MSRYQAGMDRVTGRVISGLDHLYQSLAILFATPLISRVMRRDVGSALFDLVDQPGHEAGRLRMVAAVADAVRRWEPRIRITHCNLSPRTTAAAAAEGVWTWEIRGLLTQDLGVLQAGDRVTLTLPAA